jgi:hypothetical protein
MAKIEGVIGDGVNTEFDVECGFVTNQPSYQLFDDSRGGSSVLAFKLQKQTPADTYVRIILEPAPPVDSIRYVITDGTEPPTPS